MVTLYQETKRKQFCAPYYTAFELFDTIVDQYEAIDNWNRFFKAFLAQEKKIQSFEVTY